jgi:hypothetical protein
MIFRKSCIHTPYVCQAYNRPTDQYETAIASHRSTAYFTNLIIYNHFLQYCPNVNYNIFLKVLGRSGLSVVPSPAQTNFFAVMLKKFKKALPISILTCLKIKINESNHLLDFS